MIFLKKEINLSYFKKHFILLFIILGVLFSLLYFYFIYDKKNYISEKISHDDDYWYYDGEWTCVNFGKPGEKCDVNKGVCSGEVFGSLEDQKLMVENVGKNKNKKQKLHDLCPIIY